MRTCNAAYVHKCASVPMHALTRWVGWARGVGGQGVGGKAYRQLVPLS